MAFCSEEKNFFSRIITGPTRIIKAIASVYIKTKDKNTIRLGDKGISINLIRINRFEQSRTHLLPIDTIVTRRKRDDFKSASSITVYRMLQKVLFPALKKVSILQKNLKLIKNK